MGYLLFVNCMLVFGLDIFFLPTLFQSISFIGWYPTRSVLWSRTFWLWYHFAFYALHLWIIGCFVLFALVVIRPPDGRGRHTQQRGRTVMQRLAFMGVVVLCLAAGASAPAAVEFAPKSYDARPVSFLSSTAAVVNWETAEPCETRIQIREGTFPASTPGYEQAWEKPREVAGLAEKTTAHAIMLTGLKPATRYYYRVYDPGHEPDETVWSAQPPWSREYAFATFAAPGETAIIRIPVKVLIVANVIALDTVTDSTPQPEPMPEEEIEMYKREFWRSALFYFVNSGMRYWIDPEFFVDTEWQRVGNEREDLDDFYKGWRPLRGGLRVFDSGDIANHTPAWPLREKTIYTGQVVMRCTRRWNDAQEQWVYQGSGGGTFGAVWMGFEDKAQCPAPGRTEFLGGSDICWLMTHEYKHQFESQYKHSGLQREDDRTIFCHFAPQFNPPTGNVWRWCTAYAHGRHFDGIAYQLRALTPVQYMRNVLGHIYTAKDTDGDGVPDDDPRLPLDEKRFGSDPKQASTDGTGMTDLEKIMLAKWVPAVNTPTRDKLLEPAYQIMWNLATGGKERLVRPAAGYLPPSPSATDTDEDGLPDGEDPYPLYPWAPVIREHTPTVDGDLADWKELPTLGVLAASGVVVEIRTAYDRNFLYYAIECEGPVTSLTLVIDADADGFTVGNDNLQLVFRTAAKENDPGEGSNPPRGAELDPGGRLVLRDAAIHMASSRAWPYWDTGQPFRSRAKEGEEPWVFQRPKIYGDWHDITYVSTADGNKKLVEIAIPNGTGKMPIQIGPGHTAAICVDVGVGRGTLSIYEPQTLFRTTAE
ncbi:MAG: fibronectin type III domain-containing protein [Planctomycetota bacterium]